MTRRRRASSSSTIERALRRSRWRQLLAWLRGRWLSIVAAVGFFAAAIALLTSPEFRVERIEVRRQSASAAEAVTRATQLSQVVGHNIFLVNAQRVAEEVAMVPSVLQARVIPRFPNLVEIELVERSPIATWQAANGVFLVDDQGVVMAEAVDPASPPAGVAIAVRDTTGRSLAPGDRVGQRLVLAARELVKALPAAGAQARDVEYSTQGLVLVTDRGWRVIFGDLDGPPGALNAKLANFASVAELANAQNLKIAVLDLRPRDRPFYQLAS